MKKLKVNSLFLAMIAIALASCVTSKKVNYMQEPDKQIPSYADTLTFEDYRLRPGDRLFIYVYSLDEKITKMYNAGAGSNHQMRGRQSNNEYSSYDLYSYLVDDNGNIQFPTLGDVYVKEMTTRDVKLTLEDKLGKLLREIPGYKLVSVEVNVVRRTFSVIGQQSGKYPITKEKMTIFEAIAQVGNIAEFGDRSQIKLIRERNGETIVKTFDVRSKDIVNSEFYYIEPNDILYIRQIKGRAFGINSAGTAVSIVASTISFGVFVYTIVNTGINHINNKNSSK